MHNNTRNVHCVNNKKFTIDIDNLKVLNAFDV